MNTRLLDRKQKYYHKRWHANAITEAITVRVVCHYSPTPRTCRCVWAETTNVCPCTVKLKAALVTTG